jgi:predicted unusual protein kinase regulating ubiquinone biosynthesis (AarF/ABC1/UbiB family)
MALALLVSLLFSTTSIGDETQLAEDATKLRTAVASFIEITSTEPVETSKLVTLVEDNAELIERLSDGPYRDKVLKASQIPGLDNQNVKALLETIDAAPGAELVNSQSVRLLAKKMSLPISVPGISKISDQIMESALADIDFTKLDAVASISNVESYGPKLKRPDLLEKLFLNYFKQMPLAQKKKIIIDSLRLRADAKKSQQIAAVLQNAGPALQKFFQQSASMIKDPELKEAAELLKSNVKPFDGKLSRQIIEQDLGIKIADVFLEFNETPISAGTIGQVHIGTLKSTGERVVVKVLRPGIQEQIEKEIAVFEDTFGDHPTYSNIVKKLRLTLEMEIDFRIEAQNMDLAKPVYQRADLGVYVSEYVDDGIIRPTKNTMVQKVAGGIPLEKLTPIKAGEAFRTSSVEDFILKKQILDTIFSHWFSMAVFEDPGFFHGDLHAGNAFVELIPGGKPPFKITFIDFGNAWQMGKKSQKSFIYLTEMATLGSVERVVRTLGELVNIEPSMRQALKKALKEKSWKSAPVLKRVEILLEEAIEIGIDLPVEFLNFQRSLFILDGDIREFNQLVSQAGLEKKVGYIDPYNVMARVFGRKQTKRVVAKVLGKKRTEFFGRRLSRKSHRVLSRTCPTSIKRMAPYLSTILGDTLF